MGGSSFLARVSDGGCFFGALDGVRGGGFSIGGAAEGPVIPSREAESGTRRVSFGGYRGYGVLLRAQTDLDPVTVGTRLRREAAEYLNLQIDSCLNTLKTPNLVRNQQSKELDCCGPSRPREFRAAKFTRNG